MRARRRRRVYSKKLWEAIWFYRKEAEKCFKARAYFSALIARACELEALLRTYDFMESRPRDRCKDFYSLINRALKKHWIPNDALRYWKRTEIIPLKTCLHDLREARNGVHAHLFDKDLFTRRTCVNVTYLVQSMFACLEIKNARNFMKLLHARGEISTQEYRAWRKKAGRIE